MSSQHMVHWKMWKMGNCYSMWQPGVSQKIFWILFAKDFSLILQEFPCIIRLVSIPNMVDYPDRKPQRESEAGIHSRNISDTVKKACSWGIHRSTAHQKEATSKKLQKVCQCDRMSREKGGKVLHKQVQRLWKGRLLRSKPQEAETTLQRGMGVGGRW